MKKKRMTSGDSENDSLLINNRTFNNLNRSKTTMVFCDDFHSRYVPPFPSGIRGFFMYLESPLVLLLIGSFAALMGLSVDYFVNEAIIFRHLLQEKGLLGYLIFTVITALLCTLFVHRVCPQSAGSGLPEIRLAISGILIKEFLSIRCLFAKIFGLVLAFAAGLSIGKEGPFIMVCCAFADLLLHLPIFERLREDSSKRLEMLACACAAGVTATFGTPFGGVLFSIEVTSTFYMVHNLPRAFFAAITGAIVVVLVGQKGTNRLYDSSSSNAMKGFDRDISFMDGLLCISIGIVCGLAAAFFITIVSHLAKIRDYFLSTDNKRKPWILPLKKVALVCFIATVVNCIIYFGDKIWFLNRPSSQSIKDLVFKEFRSDVYFVDSLLLYCPVKYIITALCVVLPLPSGIFAPTFIIGGVFGRLCGEILWTHYPGVTNILPFEFAIIGAAAFSSGVTRAISTAVIIMEISSDGYLNIPVSLAILAAYFTGGRFTENVYDVLISRSMLPRLRKLPKAAYDIPAWEVMKDVKSMTYLTLKCTYGDAHKVLQKSRELVIPIVDNDENMLLVGYVSREGVEQAVKYCSVRDTSFPLNVQLKRSCSVDGIRIDSPSCSSDEDGDVTKGQMEEGNSDGFDTQIIYAFLQCSRLIRWGTQSEFLSKSDFHLIVVNSAPFQIVESTPMHKVDLIFRMLKLSHTFVTRSGRLVGTLSRTRLTDFLKTVRKHKRPGVLSALISGIRQGYTPIN